MYLLLQILFFITEISMIIAAKGMDFEGSTER